MIYSLLLQAALTERWTLVFLMPQEDWKSCRSTLRTWSWLMMLIWNRFVSCPVLSTPSEYIGKPFAFTENSIFNMTDAQKYLFKGVYLFVIFVIFMVNENWAWLFQAIFLLSICIYFIVFPFFLNGQTGQLCLSTTKVHFCLYTCLSITISRDLGSRLWTC